jgi:Domain of unknown function (DUF4136)
LASCRRARKACASRKKPCVNRLSEGVAITEHGESDVMRSGWSIARRPIMQTRSGFILAAILTCGSVASLAACTSEAPRVHSAGLTTAPFEQYRTFSFGPEEAAPGETHATSKSTEVRGRARDAITTALAAKGYVLAEQKSDFIVMYGTGRAEEKFIRRSSHTDWLDENEDEDFTVGALVIDIFDGANGGQVWHGASRIEVDSNKVDPNLVLRSVQDILARFPNARREPIKVARVEAHQP